MITGSFSTDHILHQHTETIAIRGMFQGPPESWLSHRKRGADLSCNSDPEDRSVGAAGDTRGARKGLVSAYEGLEIGSVKLPFLRNYITNGREGRLPLVLSTIIDSIND